MNEPKSGDRCLLKTEGGVPVAVHYDCDDHPDGTKTSIITGERVS